MSSPVPVAVSSEHVATPAGVGALLKTWRARRRMSQLDLANIAEVSTRHLSYVETGRSRPSRELLLHLSRHLDVPLREQNDLLLAAGHAPEFGQRDLADPEMAPVVTALNAILEGSEPNPTLVMDRHWNLVLANTSAIAFIEGIAEHVIGPQLNVLRLTLHPDGLARRIDGIDAVAAHLLHRVRRQLAISDDPVLAALLAECEALVPTSLTQPSTGGASMTITMRDAEEHPTTYLSVVSTFGTALDVTTSELTIETFYDVSAATDVTAATGAAGGS